MSEQILVGDLISIAGIFRDGTMDESKQAVTENVQNWRVLEHGGSRLAPVTPAGEPDVDSYFFGRTTGIAFQHGGFGVVSQPGISASAR